MSETKLVTPSADELKAILAAHALWLKGGPAGKRAALERLDLSYADLRYANLGSANLSYADLSYANLSYANLSYADLSYADLRYASLRSANLRSVDLPYADLRYANLSYADLRYADLRYASLGSANLSYADLRYANLSYANLPTSEKWEEYLAEVVPALLVAGGKSLEEVMATDCFTCHEWSNCPMHAAFGISGADKGPILLRPRIEQFVQLFDQRLFEPVPDATGKWVFVPTKRETTEPRGPNAGPLSGGCGPS